MTINSSVRPDPAPAVAGRWWPGVAGASLLVFLLLAFVVVRTGGHDPVDQLLLRQARSWQTPGTTNAARLVLLAFSPWGVLVVTAAAVVGLRLRSRHLLLPAILVLAVVTSAGVAYLVEVAVNRPRPAAGGAVPLAVSFPSVPTVEDLVLYGLAALLLAANVPRRGPRNAVLGVGLGLGLLGGLARLFLGEQWGSDVLAGWLLGLTVLAFAWGAVLTASETPSVLGASDGFRVDEELRGDASVRRSGGLGEGKPQLEPTPRVRGVHDRE